MRNRYAAFTTTELIVVISIVVVLGAVIAVLAIMLSRPSRTSSSSATRTASSATRGASLFRADTERHRAMCRSNLHQIAQGIFAYQEPNGDFFPYQDISGRQEHWSLSLLYPHYMDCLDAFHCPSTDTYPQISISYTCGRRRSSFGEFDSDRPLNTSYGYDHHLHYRDVRAGTAVAADMDGSANDPDSDTSNHRDGQHVLYFDGHVKWQMTNYASDNPYDNIYTSNNSGVTWDADTDVVIKRSGGD